MMEKFGRYEIIVELGRGGMAQVFHARDPQFDREVAVKVVPREFLHIPDYRHRFLREARAMAALGHPGIVPVHDFGEEGDQPYMVMAYMAGGSLADRIKQGPLSLSDTTKIIGRLAPALDYAHQRGMIHRDLKPGNILFDAFGNAYLADFGIVRLEDVTSARTASGQILGTLTYMAPELHDNADPTPLVDIYALGVTLYEMLAGIPPYVANNVSAVILAHVTKPIPLIRKSRPELPEDIQPIIEAAMAKNPAQRYQSAVTMSAALSLVAGLPPVQVQSVTREQQTVLEYDRTYVESPESDDTNLTYGTSTSTPGGSAYDPTYVENTPPPAFVQSSSPQTVAPGTPMPQGGGYQTTAPIQQSRGIPGWVWVISGALFLAIIIGAVIISGALGNQGSSPAASENDAVEPAPEVITEEAPIGEAAEATEEDLPTAEPEETEEVVSVPTDEPTPVPAGLGGGGGHLAYVIRRSGVEDIYMVNDDGSGARSLTSNQGRNFSPVWSPDGTTILFYSTMDGNAEIYTMEVSSGRVTRLTNHSAHDSDPDWSPDGRRITFMSNRSGNDDIYVMNADGSNVTQLTTNIAKDQWPDWSPSGNQILFGSLRDGTWNIYVMNTSGGNQTPVYQSSAANTGPIWSPDGSQIAFTTDRNGNNDIYIISSNGGGLTRLTDNGANNDSPTWSPDGNYIAFSSNLNGNYDIYYMSANGTNARRLTTSSSDEILPDWQP